jgi:hypothetical protein
MSYPLVCVNGVVPPELTFARLVRAVTDRPVRLHDLVGYGEALPAGYGIETELTAPDGSEFQAGMDTVMHDTPVEQRWVALHELLTRPGADVPPPPPNPPPWAAGRVDRGQQVWQALQAHRIDPERLGSIKAPVYFAVAADSHPWFTQAANRLAARFARATVEVYPGNHVRPPHVSDADRFLAALRALWAAAGDTAGP